MFHPKERARKREMEVLRKNYCPSNYSTNQLIVQIVTSYLFEIKIPLFSLVE